MTDEQRESLTHTVRQALEAYLLLPEPPVFRIALYMRRLAEYLVNQIEGHDYVQGMLRDRTPTQETIDSIRQQLGELRAQEQTEFELSGREHRSKLRSILHQRLNGR